MRFRHLAAAGSLGVMLAAGCTNENRARPAAAALIIDQTHGNGTPGFLWLPPVVTSPPAQVGSFARDVAPTVAVDLEGPGLSYTRVATMSGSQVYMITQCQPDWPATACPAYATRWDGAGAR